MFWSIFLTSAAVIFAILFAAFTIERKITQRNKE